MSDSTGKVVFGFELEKSGSNPHVKFSGIKIRSCKEEATSYCPDSHPFPYLSGNYCCPSEFEKNNPSVDGHLCDGSKLGFYSKCCAEPYKRCKDPPCSKKPGQYLAFFYLKKPVMKMKKNPTCDHINV